MRRLPNSQRYESEHLLIKFSSYFGAIFLILYAGFWQNKCWRSVFSILRLPCGRTSALRQRRRDGETRLLVRAAGPLESSNCAFYTRNQAIADRCTPDIACAATSPNAVQFAGAKSQCNTDSQCPSFSPEITDPPSRPYCCNDVRAFFDYFCSGADASLLLANTGCAEGPDCVVQPALPIPQPDGCPAPPSEKCCTRIVEQPGATLRVKFDGGEDRAISSITLWDTAGGPVGASPAHLASAAVGVGSGASMTDCFLADDEYSPTPAGFESRAVVCGAAGNEVALSFPGVFAGTGGGKLAVKLCTVPAGALMAGGAAATLLVKTSGG
jgi:hypothetical protein